MSERLWRYVVGLLPLLLLVIFVPPTEALITSWSEHQPVAVRLVVPYERLPASGEVTIGFEARLAPEWHIYWIDPGDAGLPPNLSIETAAVAEDADGPRLADWELLYPAPRRFQLPGDLEAFGYEDRVLYPIRLRFEPPTTGPDSATTRLDVGVDYLVCAEECIPFSDRFEVELPVGDEAVPIPAEMARLESWLDRVPRPIEEVEGVASSGRIASSPTDPRLVLNLTGVRPSGESDVFFEPLVGVELGTPRLQSTDDGVTFSVPVEATTTDGLPAPLSIRWTATALTVGPSASPMAVSGRLEVRPQQATTTDPTAEARPTSLTTVVLAVTGLAAIGLVVLLWEAARRDGLERRTALLLRGLSFVPLAALVWISYRLGLAMPTYDLALVQLGWLALLLLVDRALDRRSSVSVLRGTVIAAVAAGIACGTIWLAWQHRDASPAGPGDSRTAIMISPTTDRPDAHPGDRP